MALQNRSTVLAVVPETTEGTPVAPTGATQYTALQEDLLIAPSFNELVNNELRSSIGEAQVILGIEQPTLSFSHYLRHSGVEGTAPDFNDLLIALFGTEVVAVSEISTTSGSSVSAIIMTGGGGASFQRGQAMLIKDPTNGYSIRPVLSVATDTITPGFNVAVAPATGVKTGKACLYKPANSGHQSLTLWCYRANGGAVEMMTGGRVNNFGISFTAGDLINANFSLEGVGYFFNPVTVTTATSYLDFLDNAATRVVQLPRKTYKDPIDFADTVASMMNNLGSANTFTCAYSSSTGAYTITSNGSTLTLKWNTGVNTANTIATLLGFTAGADSSGALTYTGSVTNFSSPYTPTFDNADPLAAKNNELFIGDVTDTTSVTAQKFDVKISDGVQKLPDVTSVSGVAGSLVTKREVVMNVVAYLNKYDAAKFARWRKGQSTALLYNFGAKLNNNWVAGKCGCFYVPTAVVSAIKLGNANGIITLELELKAFVDSSGNGEVYLNFV